MPDPMVLNGDVSRKGCASVCGNVLFEADVNRRATQRELRERTNELKWRSYYAIGL